MLLAAAALLLGACSLQAAQEPSPTQTDQAVVSITSAVPTAVSVPGETPVPGWTSFEAAVYRDPSAGFELDYPQTWSADTPMVGGDRGYFAQLTSWPREVGELPDEIPEGETIMSINVLLWEPTDNLEAYVENRKQGWSASGFEILAEEQKTLYGDWPAASFLVQTPEEETFYLITTIGRRYLVLGGSGDIGLLEEIARTIRPLENDT